jgi:hypothetical protein
MLRGNLLVRKILRGLATMKKEPWEFVRWEIAPYPGRFGTVARMVIAAVLVMLLVMTFRIPNATLERPTSNSRPQRRYWKQQRLRNRPG